MKRPLVAFVLASAFVAMPARAETPSEKADRLFKEGKQALEAKNYAEACPKLAESQQIDPGTGTLLALALCHEASKKLATAAKELAEVQSASQAGGRTDRATLAKQHLKAIEPKLSTLTIKTTDPNTELRRDGQPTIGETTAVDGGEHVIEASAPGKRTWKSTVTVRDEGDKAIITVPALENGAEPPPPPPQGALETSSEGIPRTFGWVLGGAGVLSLGVGSVFGIMALGDRSDAESGCPGSPCSNRDAIAKNDSAKTEAWVANIGIGLGVVAIAVGAYILLRSSGPERSAAK